MIAHTMRKFTEREFREPLFPTVMGQPIPFYPSGAEIFCARGRGWKSLSGPVRLCARLPVDGRWSEADFCLSHER